MQSAPPKPLSQTALLAARARAQMAEVAGTMEMPQADAAPIATLSEIFAANAPDGALTGFVAAHLAVADGPVLWVQDRLSLKEAGRPYLAGLPEGLEVILVEVSRAVDALWAMEEGLRCAALSAVVGEVYGDAPALDFTATKRIALRAEAVRVPAWLMRRGAQANLSAARQRWRVASLPSRPAAFDAQAPGPPHWEAELFRTRHGKPGAWTVERADGTLQFSDPPASLSQSAPPPTEYLPPEERPVLRAVG